MKGSHRGFTDLHLKTRTSLGWTGAGGGGRRLRRRAGGGLEAGWRQVGELSRARKVKRVRVWDLNLADCS